MSTHIVDGEFQSDKYPTCPRGKVPLSVKDKTAQDLLWEYAQRHRTVDAEFSDDLESALLVAGFSKPGPGLMEAHTKNTAAILERERSAMADGVTAVKKAIRGREWLRLGRGSYEYDDDRWKDEFGAVLDGIMQALRPLEVIAGDLSGCRNMTAEEVAAARQARPGLTTCDYCHGKGYVPGDPEGAPIEECPKCAPRPAQAETTGGVSEKKLRRWLYDNTPLVSDVCRTVAADLMVSFPSLSPARAAMPGRFATATNPSAALLARHRLEEIALRMTMRIDGARENNSETIGIGLLLALDILNACSDGIKQIELLEKEKGR